MRCDYCDQPATARIPSAASEVCLNHAIAFWTGLLAYAKEHSPVEAQQAPAPTGVARLAGVYRSRVRRPEGRRGARTGAESRIAVPLFPPPRSLDRAHR